jgi:hypothetical protein
MDEKQAVGQEVSKAKAKNQPEEESKAEKKIKKVKKQ